MKLLFDENLSPRLPKLLAADFPDCEHLRNVGLIGARDSQLWQFARVNDFTIVSKDNDFRQRSFLEGAPPKIVWLNVGNAGTEAIAELLRMQRVRLASFDTDAEAALLVLSTSAIT